MAAPGLHTNLEIASTIVAMVIGGMSLVRYFGSKQNVFCIIAAGFIGTAVLDGYHALITSVALDGYLPTDREFLAPLIWMSGRLYLSALMAFCWLTFWKMGRSKDQVDLKAKIIFSSSALFIASSILFFSINPIHESDFSAISLIYTRSKLPAVLFFVSLVGFLHLGAWRKDVLHHWIILSLGVALAEQVIVTPLTIHTFEFDLVLAASVKFVSYTFVFIGILVSGYFFFVNLARRSRELLAANNKTNEALLELASLNQAIDKHCIVSATDTENRINYVNDKFCDITGYNRGELIGIGADILNSEVHSDAFFEQVSQTIDAGEVWHGEVCDKAKDGSLIWVKSTFVPIKDNDGNIRKVYSIRTDISDGKKMESDLEASKQFLKIRVDELEDLRDRLEQQSSEYAFMAEDLRQTKDIQIDAISAIAEGFVLWDNDGRLIMCNEMFKTIYAGVADILEPGLKYEYFVREAYKRGVFILDGDNFETAVQSRLSRHNGSVTPLDEKLGDGRWIRVSEREASERRIAGIIFDVSERKKSERAIKRMAETDTLTGLPNRSLFHQSLNSALKHSKRTGDEVAVMLLDLDHFKNVNDTMGHPVGDALLCEVARRLIFCLRDTDTVARLGGDEFAIIATHVREPLEIDHLANRIVNAIAKPYELDGKKIFSGASLGITVFPHDNGSSDDLLRNADIAMYRAKESGRGGYKLFDNKMNTEVHAHQEIELLIHEALEEDQLNLYFQPQIDIASGKVTGAEALLRWTHPIRGVISPAEFIPVAEMSRLIIPLGDWVLNTACRFNKDLQNQGLPPIVMAVNLSPLQFKHQDMLDYLNRALESSGLDAKWLELEITESIAMEKGVVRLFHKLKKLGVQLAIDDFGKGYSSLNRLKDFPVDRLKIDRSFVHSLHSEWDRSAICRAIIQLGNSLKLKVIAEGIETIEELEKLAELKCDEAQGYLFSQALPPKEFTEFLKIHSPCINLADTKDINWRGTKAS